MNQVLKSRVARLEGKHHQILEDQEPLVVWICDSSKTQASPVIIFQDPNTPESVKDEWREKYPSKCHAYSDVFPEDGVSE